MFFSKKTKNLKDYRFATITIKKLKKIFHYVISTMKKGFLLVHVLDLLKLRYEPNKIFYQDFLCRVKLYKKKVI
jgi:hypothetical protein